MAGLLAFLWLISVVSLLATFVGPTRRAMARAIFARLHLPLRRARWILGGSVVSLFFLFALVVPDQNQAEASRPARASRPDRQAVIVAMCQAITAEDEDNHGIRADGQPWDADDLVTDYGFSLGWSVPESRRQLAELLASEPREETLLQFCASHGIRIASTSSGANTLVRVALSVAQGHSLAAAREEQERKRTNAPITEQERDSAREIFCEALREHPDSDLGKLVRSANTIYAERTHTDQPRTLHVMGETFAGLTEGRWSLSDCR